MKPSVPKTCTISRKLACKAAKIHLHINIKLNGDIMPYVLLTLATALTSMGTISAAIFNKINKKSEQSTLFYNMLWMVAVFISWTVMFLLDMSFDVRVLPYAIGFGVSFAIIAICEIRALLCGPITLSTLILQMSLIAATVWGFFFWGTKPTVLSIIGLALVVVSIFLCVYTKRGKDETISLKWIILVSLCFLSNSACTIIQKQQQLDFGGQHGKLMMMVATFISTCCCVVLWLIKGRGAFAKTKPASLFVPMAAGFFNSMQNLLVILLATMTISAGIVYPTLAVGSLMLTSIVSVLIFKEKLSAKKWIGIAIGAVAILLLNL